MEDQHISREDLKDMLEKIGFVAAGAKVYTDGVQYVRDVEFWKWLTANVVKAPIVNGVETKLTDSQAISEWVNTRLHEGKIDHIEHIFVNRGAEFDFVKRMQDDPFELLSGSIWRMATSQEDATAGIDAVKERVFGLLGQETHQIKAGLSDSFRKVDLSQYIPEPSEVTLTRLNEVLHKKSTPVDVIDVNEKIYSWRNSEEGIAKIARRGDNHPNVVQSFNDEDLKASGARRLEAAKEGLADNAITFEGVFKQVGSGAIVGTVIFVGVSAVSNYQEYKLGYINGNEFANRIMRDSLQGGLQGGAVAAVNIPVQLAAGALNVGAPVTIPVMVVLSVGLRQIINPMFGKGEYKEILESLHYTTDVARAFSDFSRISYESFGIQKKMLSNGYTHRKQSLMLDSFAQYTDDLLAKELEDF